MRTYSACIPYVLQLTLLSCSCRIALSTFTISPSVLFPPCRCAKAEALFAVAAAALEARAPAFAAAEAAVEPSELSLRHAMRALLKPVFAVMQDDPALSQFFSKVVLDHVVPGYSSVVPRKYQVVLSTMRPRVERAAYISRDDFLYDVRALQSNCHLFNLGTNFTVVDTVDAAVARVVAALDEPTRAARLAWCGGQLADMVERRLPQPLPDAAWPAELAKFFGTTDARIEVPHGVMPLRKKPRDRSRDKKRSRKTSGVRHDVRAAQNALRQTLGKPSGLKLNLSFPSRPSSAESRPRTSSLISLSMSAPYGSTAPSLKLKLGGRPSPAAHVYAPVVQPARHAYAPVVQPARHAYAPVAQPARAPVLSYGAVPGAPVEAYAARAPVEPYGAAPMQTQAASQPAQPPKTTLSLGRKAESAPAPRRTFKLTMSKK